MTAFYPMLIYFTNSVQVLQALALENHNSFSFPESSALARNFEIFFSCSKEICVSLQPFHGCPRTAGAALVLSGGASGEKQRSENHLLYML